MAITCRNDAASDKHVDNSWDEQPPIVSLIGVVKKAVLAPDFHVFVQDRRVTFCVFITASQLRNPYGEKDQDTGENGEGDGSQKFRRPRITTRELVNAVQRPHTIDDQDQVGDGSCQ